tara:strand:- start:2061 stop:3218 length:1158 start_codon:yes stop_codon:yes gene_type:complete
MKKKISILGSTGSIGLSTLKIINKKKNLFDIHLLAADKKLNLISSQIRKYRPKIYIINDKKTFNIIEKKFKKSKTLILNNFDSINDKKKIDITVSAIPGIAGLKPTISMIKNSKKILIANKESIICGWDLIKKNSLKYKSEIVPVDSEHFSIFQLLKEHKKSEIKNFFITASGGPFLNLKKNKFKNIKPKDALSHPRWSMGKKISVDSATLMNKILELIEAQKLFNIPEKKLKIVIHPESLVHAVIELKNGLTKFIYHDTSMIVPIANAIFNNNLLIEDYLKSKNHKLKNLTFQEVKKSTFPIIRIKKRINEFPSTSIIINASNEILVDHFLQKKIPFSSISKIIMIILNDRNYRKYAIRKPKNIDQINEIDLWAKKATLKIINL